MIRFRPFLNTDAPAIVDLWRQQSPFCGLYLNLTRELLDLHVLGKPFFDRHGLILAEDVETGQVSGFVHAGFGPNKSLSDLDCKSGIVSQLRVRPGEHAVGTGCRLLDAAEKYLRDKGAERAAFGCDFPHTPFYLGLYGGSRMPGVMEGDLLVQECLKQTGFEHQATIHVLERDLENFRAVMDRQQLNLRRQYQVKTVVDPLEASWWESCTMGMAERDRFSIFFKAKRQYVGSVSFWDMLPMSSEMGTMTRGLYDLRIDEEMRRSGMATYLVGESLRNLSQQYVGRVQVQVRQSDTASMGVFEKMAFEKVTSGSLMAKEL